MLNLICVGKLKNRELSLLCENYLKRISQPHLKIYEVKASADNLQKEASAILKKLSELGSQQFNVLLSEWGQEMTTERFAQWLNRELTQRQVLNFIIAGAAGPSDDLKRACQISLSLSQLTFPHKLARLILIEQLYRAQTIRQGHPYHN